MQEDCNGSLSFAVISITSQSCLRRPSVLYRTLLSHSSDLVYDRTRRPTVRRRRAGRSPAETDSDGPDARLQVTGNGGSDCLRPGAAAHVRAAMAAPEHARAAAAPARVRAARVRAARIAQRGLVARGSTGVASWYVCLGVGAAMRPMQLPWILKSPLQVSESEESGELHLDLS
jgi:hypothetical protein